MIDETGKDSTKPSVSPWKYGKKWVYSITFDEAVSDLHRFAIPILDKYNVPGHLEVVVGQMGQIRNIGSSSLNGFKHMGSEELRDMLSRGWGVSNHSWSHEIITFKTVNKEIGHAKKVLEEAIGEPITIYCAPGNNDNMNDAVLDACRRYGYLGAMSLTDALNRPDDEDMLWINRTFLHHQGYTPFFSEFNPFRNILHAKRDQGWLIDYCHCPLEEPIHPNKDCSEAQLRERIETIVNEGGDEVWLARVEDAVDYRYMRRHTCIQRKGKDIFSIFTEDLPSQVANQGITLQLPKNIKAVEINSKNINPYSVNTRLLIDFNLSKPIKMRLIR
ncbi:MAG: polysaccharide deacetylase family protein [Victivallaceae bacterium]|nr:polysaccharide deacetylase family protein [Victivallaceae bacterium]